MEAHTPGLIISWHTAVLKLVLKVKSCESAPRQKSQTRRGTLWLSTWLVLRCQPFLKHGQTFCFRCLPFLIASLLSKQKSYFSFSHESSLQICVTVSNNKLKSGTANVPVQPCTIIASTWLHPSSALSTVKNPKQCPHTRSATNSSRLNFSCMLGG